MTSTLRERLRVTWRVVTSRHFIKQILWVAAFWMMVIAVILVNISFLRATYPDAVRPDDLLLDIMPEIEAFVVFGDVMTGSLFALTVFYFGVWQGGIQEIPRLLFLLGVMYLLRSFVINLTPLAQIQRPEDNFPESHIIAQTFYHGMFYSGHTASSFIQAFFFKGYRHQWLLFVLASGAAFALIASHSHYTIDVVGGFFVAYFITNVDWMKIVPGRLRRVRWMPWYRDDMPAMPLDTAADPRQNGHRQMAAPLEGR
jgi:hypothetical protein